MTTNNIHLNGHGSGPVLLTPDELSSELRGAVAAEVRRQFTAEAKGIAEGVVQAMLDDQTRAALREDAIAQAEAILAGDPDDDGRQAAPAGGDPEADEPPREMMYPHVVAFVEKQVAPLYRRQVHEQGSENHARWCEEWWRHGEAVARFRALWMAFEQLRLGEGAEQSVWWLDHVDRHMGVLLSPNTGPFRYCSVREGHSTRLQALPCAPAPAALGGGGDQVRPSGLVLPAPGYRPRGEAPRFP